MGAGRRRYSGWIAPLGLAPLGVAAFVAPAAAAPLAVTIAEQDSGASVKLRWDDGRITAPAVQTSVANNVLVVQFAEPFEIDLSPLAAIAPNVISGVSADSDRRTLRFALARPFAAKASPEGETLLISLAPPVAPKSATPAVEATADTAALSVGVLPDFTRLSFLFEHGATVLPFRKGDVLDLKFSRAVDVDISQLHILPPKFIQDTLKANKPGQPLELRLTLDPDVRVRSFVEGPRVIVDLLPPDPKVVAAKAAAAAAAAAKAARPPPPPPAPPPIKDFDPMPPGGVVRVQATELPDATQIVTHWARPAKVAAFRRGEAIWILFDTKARLDITGVARVSTRHQDIQTVTGDGVIGLRIPTPPEMLVTAKADGNNWTFTLSDHGAALDSPAPITRETPEAGGARLVVDFGRPGVVRWIEDPVIGDKFAAAMLDGPIKGVDTRRATLEAAILPAAQGAAIEPRADGVGATFLDGKLVVTRGAGLIVDAASPSAAPDQPLGDGASSANVLLDLASWGAGSKQRALDVLQQLQRAAAKEGFDVGAKADARMNLARFLLANELAPETLGALRAAAVNQPELELDPRYKLMRAAANLMLGRAKDAQADLSAGVLADDPTAALWRGYAAGLSENWAEARRSLEQGRSALQTQPQDWRARFNLSLAESALELDDFAAADTALSASLGEATTEDVRAQGEILKARLLEARGDMKGALATLAPVLTSRDENSAVRAVLESTRIQHETGAATAQSCAEALEALRFRWRGDGLELEVIQTLGHVYEDMGRWRDALSIMHAAAARFPDLPAARRMRLDMADAFSRLYLEGEADKMQPIEALGLFYEFKDLTPIGPEGDRMIRQLSARLVSVDLLEKASELLQYQVDNRLDGVGQAQVAADLAAIYIADRQPDKALTVIEATRQPGVPADIAASRRVIEARALLDLGRYDHALELLEKDQSIDAMRVRAEAAWRQKKWPDAVAAIWVVLQRGPKPADDLSADDRAFVLRAAIAAVLSGDDGTIGKLRGIYAKRMAASADADAFDLVTSGVAPGDVRLRDLSKRIARTDLIDRVMDQIKGRLTEQASVSATPRPAA